MNAAEHRMTTGARRALYVVLVLAVCASLGACAGLPTTSAVQARGAINNEPTEQPPNIVFNPPRPGESPTQIVREFLRANAGTDSDHGVARQFLSRAASDAWQPSQESVTVLSSDQDVSVSQTFGGPFRAVGQQVATMDSDGSLTEFAEPRRAEVDFGVGLVNGEWRITKLPNAFGSWLSESDFTLAFSARQVFFADPQTKTLVPDTRWVQTTGDVTALARMALGSPPAWMKGMAHINIPVGTGLQVDAVPVDPTSGLATVDLTSSALQADPTTRTGLWAAMIATLGQLSSVRNVQLTVAGVRFEAPNLPAQPGDASDLGYQVPTQDTREIITRRGIALQWSDPDQNPADNPRQAMTNLPKLPVLPTNWYLTAASASGTEIAAISGSRATLGRFIAGSRTELNFGTMLTRPTFSKFDELFVAGQALSDGGPQREGSTGGTVWVIDTAAKPSAAQSQVIDTPWVANAQIVALKVAPEGDRMALITKDRGGATKLWIAGIVRDVKHQAIALTTPTQQGLSLHGMLDVAWVDAVTLAVLGSPSANEPVQPVTVPLGGFLSPLGVAAGAVAVTAGGVGPNQLFVATDRQTVLTQQGARWAPLGTTTEVIVPGD